MNPQVTPANQRQPPPRSDTWAAPPGPSHFPAQMPASVAASGLTPVQDGFSPRQWPFYPSEMTAAVPRAIQPRPPLSAGQFGSESGPRPVSPSWEPPRKRGRPTKVEVERRKAEAQARGEIYPSPRRPAIAKVKRSPTPSGSANATSDRSLPTPQAMLYAPEMQKQELHSQSVGGNDVVPPDWIGRRHTDPAVAVDMDPVRGIIRSQASQDRRLPPPPDMQPRPESFVAYTPPRDHSFPVPRTVEAPFGGGPRSFTEGGILHSTADHPTIPHTENPPPIPPSARPIQAVPRGTNT